MHCVHMKLQGCLPKTARIDSLLGGSSTAPSSEKTPNLPNHHGQKRAAAMRSYAVPRAYIDIDFVMHPWRYGQHGSQHCRNYLHGVISRISGLLHDLYFTACIQLTLQKRLVPLFPTDLRLAVLTKGQPGAFHQNCPQTSLKHARSSSCLARPTLRLRLFLAGCFVYRSSRAASLHFLQI